MPAPPERRFFPRAWLLALLAGGIIFSGRSALVFYAGSPVPYHDQWIAEATHLVVQDAQQTLTWHNFFIPHGDHLIVVTRLIAYALYRLTGRWDMLAEMLVNNALIAAAFGFLLYHALRRFPSIGLALGGNARAGLEDTLHLRKGQLSEGNGPLVARTVALAGLLDRSVATVEETERLLGLPR